MSNLEPSTPTSRCRESNVASDNLAFAKAESSLNKENSRQNADIPISFQSVQPTNPASIFLSNTTAPSPPPGLSTLSNESTKLSNIDTSSHLASSLPTPGRSSPLSAGLRIHTDIIPGYTMKAVTAVHGGRSGDELSPPPKSLGIARTPSIKNILSSSIGSNSGIASVTNSALSSPMLNAMPDVTPLPSPLLSGDSPGPWKKLVSRPTSRDLMVPMTTSDSVLVTSNGESISSAIANQSKRRAYHGLPNESELSNSVINKEKIGEGHSRNRSISDYTPEAIQIPKIRNITVSGSHVPISEATPDSATSTDSYMRREPNLAVQRGLAPPPR
jgi:protein-serine/threonine kinase